MYKGNRRIKCFFLFPSWTATNNDSAEPISVLVYTSEAGGFFHLGTEPLEWVEVKGSPLHPAPVGAMWDSYWYRGYSELIEGGGQVLLGGPDGLILTVRTPGGDWIIDSCPRRAGITYGLHWMRRGVIPDITVSPPIYIPGKYHGRLHDGFLEEAGYMMKGGPSTEV